MTQLQDEKEITKKDLETIVTLWTGRFKEAKEFREPYDRRNLRMYKIYRSIRDWMTNYAYDVNIMPPIGYEIIETIKPRLSAAKHKKRILPTKKTDIDNPSLTKWDNLIEYNFETMDFASEKASWIFAMLVYGNGTVQLSWDTEAKTPSIEVCDNWLLYIDPQAQEKLYGARWIIKRSWKEKELIQQEEQERGEDHIYDPIRLEKLDNQAIGDDPRRDRREVNAKKMSQINDATTRDNATDSSDDSGQREHSEYKAIELLECYDFVKQEIVTIGNRAEVLRKEPNPYGKINKSRRPGNLFIDLPCTPVPWEYYAMTILEPVETLIYEIADSRNQAMDNIIYNLDPITKIKRGKGYKKEGLKKGPGAMWFVDRADDIVTERPTDIGASWIDKDEILRRDIQTALALSEYTQGMPQSSQEPMGKVELLLMQTNIRFSQMVRQLENAMTEMVNIMIELNQHFLDEDKAYRIVGEDFAFDEFTSKDKEVLIDAKVDIIPKKEKSPEQESRDILETYRMFVIDDPPKEGNDEDMYFWEKKKAELQKLVLDRLGLEEYEDVLIREPKKPTADELNEKQKPMPLEGDVGMPEGMPQNIATPGAESIPPGAMPPGVAQQLPQKEPIMPPEGGMTPQATTQMTEPNPGFLQGLLKKIGLGRN
jgi:hypothetical protein